MATQALSASIKMDADDATRHSPDSTRWQQCRSLLLIVDCLFMVLPQSWKEQMQEVRSLHFVDSFVMEHRGGR